MASFWNQELKIRFMKNRIKTIFLAASIASGAAVTLSGCYETSYAHRYNHHTRGWYERRHMAPPGGVNFEVDVRR
jgi:hypothetical protein